MKQVFLLILLFLYTKIQSQQAVLKKLNLDKWQIEIANKSTKNVYDYYLLLPNDVFDCETGLSFDKTKRDELIIIKDLQNGFISFANFSIALFKDRKNQKNYIAISSNNSGRETTCGGFNTIIEFHTSNYTWICRSDLYPEDTKIASYIKKFYDDPTDAYTYQVVPQHGLVIEFKDEFIDGIIYKIKWTGTRFEIID